MTQSEWKEVEKELFLQFPKLSDKILISTLDSLKQAEKNMSGTTIPYILRFRTIVLRIGVQVKDSDIKSFVLTPAGQELDKLLKQ